MATAHMRKQSQTRSVSGLKQRKPAKKKAIGNEPTSHREAADELRQRAGRIVGALARLYPQARISLDFTTPWQCLGGGRLSAQCTDERVNRTTPELFGRLPDPAAMAEAPTELVEQL